MTPRIKSAGSALLAVSVVAVTFGICNAATATTAAPAQTTNLPEGVQTVVRKTVLQTGNASGEVSNNSMYTQVSAVGDGSSTIQVPVGTSSARNLNSFGAPATDGDDVVFPITVDGNTNRRIYTTADVQPVKVTVKATLDGKPIEPTAIINQTGVLKVTYIVTNTTARTIDTTYRNGAGNDVPMTANLADPFVGSLAVTLPSQFGEITAPGATVVGDGKGGTQLGYQLVLFDPLGSPTQTLTYESRIASGTLPEATFGFLPIIPFDNSTISTTKEAYASGAASGEKIYAAGLELGDNLLKLQSGAAELLAGLGKLTDGAVKLQEGLENDAIPGAEALSAGAGKLAKGLNGEAIPASKQIADGSADLAKGLSNDLVPGAEQIADGLQQVDAALRDLPDTVAEEAGYQQLTGAVEALQIGLQNLADFQGPVLQSFATQVTEYLTSIKALAQGADCTGTACAEIAQDATSGLASNSNVTTGLEGIVENAATGADGLSQVYTGIATLVQSIAEGLYENEDWQALVAGGETLAEGAQTAADGADQLSDGTQQLADGLVPAGEGASALADGGTKLAEGLVPAAEGAGQIADGLGQASDGVVQIEDGAGQLKTQGTDKLMDSGDQAASEFAGKVAVLNALQVEGEAGAGIPYGNATGPNTTTTGAYQLILSPAASTGADNAARYTVGILGFLVAGALATLLWRRRTSV